MKFFILNSALIYLSLAVGKVSLAQEVCKIEATVYNAKFEAPKGPIGDFMSTKLAKHLVTTGQSQNCIDLRTQGAMSKRRKNTLFIEQETIGYLTNKTPTHSELKEIKNKLCKDAGKDCKATTSIQCKSTESLSLSHDLRDGLPGSSSDGLNRGKIKSGKIGSLERFPKFSNACETGKHKDSWNDTASTVNAKELIQKSGLKYNEIRSLDLVEKDKAFWVFGFPDHTKSPKPTTNPSKKLKINPTEGIDI